MEHPGLETQRGQGHGSGEWSVGASGEAWSSGGAWKDGWGHGCGHHSKSPIALLPCTNPVQAIRSSHHETISRMSIMRNTACGRCRCDHSCWI
eukprot:scaffold17760_cov127-Isochrysis_galbana.AAC.3